MDTTTLFLILAYFRQKNLAWISKIYLPFCSGLTMTLYFWWLELDAQAIPSFNADYIQSLSTVGNKIEQILLNQWNVGLNISSFLWSYRHYLVPIVILVLLWSGIAHLIKKNQTRPLLLMLSSGILFLYVAVSALNFNFNQKNVVAMKKNGFFDKTVIGTGHQIFLYDEFVSYLGYGLEVSKYKKNLPLFIYQKNLMESLLDQAGQQVGYDPIGFKEKIKRRDLKEVSNEHHDRPIKDCLDYQAPVRFKVWPN